MECRQTLWHKVTLGLVVGVQQHHESMRESPKRYVSMPSLPSDIRVRMSALSSSCHHCPHMSGYHSARLSACTLPVLQHLLQVKLPVLQHLPFAAALLSLWPSAPAVALGPSHFQTGPEVVVIDEASVSTSVCTLSAAALAVLGAPGLFPWTVSFPGRARSSIL